MIIVSNRISVKPEYAEAFEERFANRAAMVEQREGFISFRLLRPSAPEHPYVVMTTWESHEAFTAWTESEEFRHGHAQSGTLPEETYRGMPVLEIHSVIQDA
ncbi:MAG: antibiotic biosynthesis monooxygenase family protein [Anaerolineae bacterium]